MTLQDIGAIGEFVGAFLLFVSLVYVGIQVRHNSVNQRAQIRQDWSNVVVGWNRYLIENPDLLKAVQLGITNGFKDLDENQAAILVIYFQSALWTFSTLYRNYLQGLIDDETWHEVNSLIERYARSKAFQEYWPGYNKQVGSDFRAFMQETIDQNAA